MNHREHHQNRQHPHSEIAPLTVRALNDGDRSALTRLAQRDSAAVPPLPLLGAELGDELVAAVPIVESERPAIADPFLPTERAVSILQLRARQLRGKRSARPRSHQPQLWPAGGRLPAP
jgi:hypothetical protein